MEYEKLNQQSGLLLPVLHSTFTDEFKNRSNYQISFTFISYLYFVKKNQFIA